MGFVVGDAVGYARNVLIVRTFRSAARDRLSQQFPQPNLGPELEFAGLVLGKVSPAASALTPARLFAERRLGEMLRGVPLHLGGRPGESQSPRGTGFRGGS